MRYRTRLGANWDAENERHWPSKAVILLRVAQFPPRFAVWWQDGVVTLVARPFNMSISVDGVFFPNPSLVKAGALNIWWLRMPDAVAQEDVKKEHWGNWAVGARGRCALCWATTLQMLDRSMCECSKHMSCTTWWEQKHVLEDWGFGCQNIVSFWKDPPKLVRVDLYFAIGWLCARTNTEKTWARYQNFN